MCVEVREPRAFQVTCDWAYVDVIVQDMKAKRASKMTGSVQILCACLQHVAPVSFIRSDDIKDVFPNRLILNYIYFFK